MSKIDICWPIFIIITTVFYLSAVDANLGTAVKSIIEGLTIVRKNSI